MLFYINKQDRSSFNYKNPQGKSFTLTIYNRYGEKVFETIDITEGWNGNHKGKPENIGVFAYYLEYEYVNGDKGSLKGNITLVK